MSHVHSRNIRRRRLEQALDENEIPKDARIHSHDEVRPSVMRRAKKNAHQKLRRALHALLNVLPHRAEDASTWMTTTTDDALAVPAHLRGHAHVEVSRAHTKPSWVPLRERLAREAAASGSSENEIQPPDFDEDSL